MEITFIVIDDSELDRFLAKKTIQLADKSLKTTVFHNVENALDTICENEKQPSVPTVILLDLQMPGLDGFQFMDAFEKLPDPVKQGYIVIILTILTSEGNPNEIYRILNYKNVYSIIEKPLTKYKLLSVLSQLSTGS